MKRTVASKSNAVNEKENIYSLKGFSKVFKFTLTQTFKNKAYIISLIVFVLTMSLMGPIQYFSAKSSMSASESLLSNKVKDAATTNLIVLNETNVSVDAESLGLSDNGLGGAALDIIADGSKTASDVISGLGKTDVAVIIRFENNTYKVETVRAEDSDIQNEELDKIGSIFEEGFNTARMKAQNLDQEKIAMLQKGVYTNSVKTQEEYIAAKSDTYTQNQMMGIFSVYSILIMIVSTMSASFIVSSVTEEKISKLVEGLLVSVRPMALLMGKVCGMMVYVITILISGFVSSKVVNLVMEKVLHLDMSAGASAGYDFAALFKFGAVGLIIILVCILITYLAFGGFSGMLGAACTKTEDAQSATGTVTMLVFIGYFASMMITSNDKAIVSTVASLVPPVSFFTAPVYYLTGRISLPIFAASLLIQIAIVVGICLLCAKTYRKLIINDSSKPKLRDVLRAVKG